jgi:hypothetical protein
MNVKFYSLFLISMFIKQELSIVYRYIYIIFKSLKSLLFSYYFIINYKFIIRLINFKHKLLNIILKIFYNYRFLIYK